LTQELLQQGETFEEMSSGGVNSVELIAKLIRSSLEKMV